MSDGCALGGSRFNGVVALRNRCFPGHSSAVAAAEEEELLQEVVVHMSLCAAIDAG